MISYIIWDVDPSLFDGFEYLRWYGLCWVAGMLLGYKIMSKIYKSEGIPLTELDNLTMYIVLGVIAGARLGHILFYDPVYYWNNPIEILPFRINPTFQFTGFAGLASHGGIIGALLTLYFYSRKFKRDYVWLLDRLMIAGVATGGLIRIGNLMNSEIIGIPADVPWAFIFTRVDDIPRHPAQLYEAIFYLTLSLSLYLIWKSGKLYTHRGFIFGMGMTMIFTQRFFIEFLKERQVAFEADLTLNMGQILSVPMVVMGIVMMMWSYRDSRKRAMSDV